jgi:hypothetical protein
MNGFAGRTPLDILSSNPAPRTARASGNGSQLLARHGQNDRVIALGRRNWLFAGSNSGGDRAAATYSILQTAKLNGANPQAYLIDTLARIAAGHPINRIDELMPWAYQHPDIPVVP